MNSSAGPTPTAKPGLRRSTQLAAFEDSAYSIANSASFYWRGAWGQLLSQSSAPNWQPAA